MENIVSKASFPLMVCYNTLSIVILGRGPINMEFERINEDTIRVVVTNDDLADHGISVVDLLGNQEEIERFFYSILEEADVDHEFINNDAVTFQVLPSKNGLELFISKNLADKGQMDTMLNAMLGQRDANVTNDDVSDELLDQLLDYDQPQQGSTSTSTFAKDSQVPKEVTQQNQQNEPTIDVQPKGQEKRQLLVKFKDFENVLQLANTLMSDIGETALIRYQAAYYLVINFDAILLTEQVQNITAIAREYGDVSVLSSDLLREHGQVIFNTGALAALRHYFD